jgi:hypothetical protein
MIDGFVFPRFQLYLAYMSEQFIDPELVKHWDEILDQEGLAPIDESEQIPIEALNLEPIKEFQNEMEILLEKYESLPYKLKVDIIDDLKKQRALGVTYEEILDRLKLLAEQGIILQKMTSKDSDRKSKPNTTSPNPKKIHKQTIDELIASMEKLLNTGKKNDSIH